MNKYKGIFKRYEKKFLLSTHQYKKLQDLLQDKMNIDEYGKCTICNIYFDTPNYQLIRRSIEKPTYKEKLRLRSYGIPDLNSTVFIELKKKYKGVVYKRRINLKLSEALSYLYFKEPLSNTTQISEEISFFMDFYKDVNPAMYISYDRTAFYNIDNKDLRITFDSNIRWRKENLDLTQGAWGNELLPSNKIIMEIKIPGAMPVWLSKILDSLNIYPSSYSKYGNAYISDFKYNNQKLNKEITGGIYCA